ncbi:MAG: bacteriocin family protein [Actinomycetota bacterium]|nr:bacteriocin family protein [Actinomycetota bacterium]
MNHLLREVAPLSDAAWLQVGDEAKSRLTNYLAARRLVDFSGPSGWQHSAHNLGTSTEIDGPSKVSGVMARSRRVLPLCELRVPFVVSRAELDDADRGNEDVDLDPLAEAAAAIALAENLAVFHGYPAASIVGITEASSHQAVHVTGGLEEFPKFVASGVERLRLGGVDGPYGLALSSELWTDVVETTEHGGYPLFNHLGRILDGGPIVWAPGVEGGVVISQRGGDYLLDSGQDLSVGYLAHDATTVTLYLEESFTFRALSDDAAVALTF